MPVAFAKVKVEFDQEADFSHIRQYEWRTHPIFEKNPDLQQVYATGIQLVLTAGNKELAKRGLEPVEFSPDVFITFFIYARAVQDVKTNLEPSPWWGAGYGWYAPSAWIATTEVDNYLDGSLVIDVVDARSSKMIWRAYCGEEIRDMRNRHENIDSAVRKAFDRFPPKKK